MSSSSSKHSLGDLFKKAEEAGENSSASKQTEEPSMVVRSVTLSPAADRVLDEFRKSVSFDLGRRVGRSAVVRALVRRAARDIENAEEEIAREVDAEIQSGEVVWGKQKGG